MSEHAIDRVEIGQFIIFFPSVYDRFRFQKGACGSTGAPDMEPFFDDRQTETLHRRYFGTVGAELEQN